MLSLLSGGGRNFTLNPRGQIYNFLDNVVLTSKHKLRKILFLLQLGAMDPTIAFVYDNRIVFWY